MQIKDARIKRLTNEFLEEIGKFENIREYIGEIVFVTKRTAAKDTSDTVAYIKRSGKLLHPDIPVYKIFLIKEEILKLSDDEVLNTLAHEVSHILFHLTRDSKRTESHDLIEGACDALADAFFGFPKPAGSQVGYIYKIAKKS